MVLWDLFNFKMYLLKQVHGNVYMLKQAEWKMHSLQPTTAGVFLSKESK